jgi:hypothetical protein
MNCHLIDPTGRRWTYPAFGLAGALGRSNPDIDIWSYAVRRLGAIEIATSGSIATLSWQAARVTKRAIAAAAALLAALGPREIRFRSEISTWIEIGAEATFGVAERLRLGCQPYTADRARPAFFMQPHGMNPLIAALPRNRVETNRQHQAVLFDWWRQKQGVCSRAEILEFFYRYDVIDRAGLVEMDDDVRFSFYGCALDVYRRYDPSWVDQVVGKRFTDQPDPVYGAWCAHAYRQVFAAATPRYDYVDASVHMPGLSAERTRYDRMLLPWVFPDGTRVVSLLSFKRAPG